MSFDSTFRETRHDHSERARGPHQNGRTRHRRRDERRHDQRLGHGELYKSFYVRDGLGIKMLQKHGIEIAIITAAPLRSSPSA